MAEAACIYEAKVHLWWIIKDKLLFINRMDEIMDSLDLSTASVLTESLHSLLLPQ